MYPTCLAPLHAVHKPHTTRYPDPTVPIHSYPDPTVPIHSSAVPTHFPSPK